MDRALQDLIDKQAIREVVLTYCRGIDRLDFDLVRSAYHPDAIDHHTGFDGNIDEYIAWVTPKLSAIGDRRSAARCITSATTWSNYTATRRSARRIRCPHIGAVPKASGWSTSPAVRDSSTTWSDATVVGRSRSDGPYESGPARTRVASSTPKGLVRVGVVTPRIPSPHYEVPLNNLGFSLRGRIQLALSRTTCGCPSRT